MQSRFKGCILLHTNMERSQKVTKVSIQRTGVVTQRAALWAGIRSERFHKNNESYHCPIETHMSPCDSLRRHIVAKSNTRSVLKRPIQNIMVKNLRKKKPMSATRIYRSNNRFSGNGDDCQQSK